MANMINLTINGKNVSVEKRNFTLLILQNVLNVDLVKMRVL